jgi:CRISPR system Cascade subunit CasB
VAESAPVFGENNSARRAFLAGLRAANRETTVANNAVAGAARARLAVLRRGLAGPRQQADAYAVVYEFGPPEGEEHIWVLVGALFAQHPCDAEQDGYRTQSLAAALGRLAGERAGGAAAVDRRFGQLVGVEDQSLAHHVRQAVHLLRGASIPVDYAALIDDLLILLDTDTAPATAQRQQRVRLRWIADYNRAKNRSI